MSPAALQSYLGTPGFPRVSGDEPGGLEAGGEVLEFSPRERG